MGHRLLLVVLFLFASLSSACKDGDGKNVTPGDVVADTPAEDIGPGDVDTPDSKVDIGKDGQDTEDMVPDADIVQPPPYVDGVEREYFVDGGTRLFLPGMGELEVPEGALPEPMWITATPIEAPSDPSFEPAGLFHDFGPAGLEFDVPLIVRLPVAPEDADQDWGLVGKSPSGDWIVTPAVYNWETGKLEAQIHHFSPWGFGIAKVECKKDSDCNGAKVDCETLTARAKHYCSPKGKCLVAMEVCPLAAPVCQDAVCHVGCKKNSDCPGTGKPFCVGDGIQAYQCKEFAKPPKRLLACVPKPGTNCAAQNQDCIAGHCLSSCYPACGNKACGPDACGNGNGCGYCDPGDECNASGQCVPANRCDGKECGSDGYGGTCGGCTGGKVCYQNQCKLPDCTGKTCGSDGAGGSCGNCPSDDWVFASFTDDGTCKNGVCECTNKCWSYWMQDLSIGESILRNIQNQFHCFTECGYDNCGNNCGQCSDGKICNDGLCEECVPNCGERTCGADGCGGSCGECNGENQYCTGTQCATTVCGNGWCEDAAENMCSCPQDCTSGLFPNFYSEICGCTDENEPINISSPPDGTVVCINLFALSSDPYHVCYLCPETSTCGNDGTCVGGNGCGSQQCGYAANTGQYCGSCYGEQCVNGHCLPNCTGSCEGKECGSDGCYSVCGQCANGFSCNYLGQCAGEACGEPCQGLECGEDSCGNPCGACADGFQCTEGACLPDCVPQCDGRECGPNSCGGLCGECAPGYGCNDNMGICEPCIPNCDLRECGPDGCGGYCGECAMGEICEIDLGQCLPCEPQCGNGKNCGDDGCGGVCGVCPDGLDCIQDFQCETSCVPICDNKPCGNDGCGGSCGDCGITSYCVSDGLFSTFCETDGCGDALGCLIEAQFNPDAAGDCYLAAGNYVGQYNAMVSCLDAYCSNSPTEEIYDCSMSALVGEACDAYRIACIMSGPIPQ